MGASSSKPSADSLAKSSAKLKDVCEHIVVGVFKKHGTFEYDPSLEEFMEDQMTAVRVRRCVDPMKAKGYGLGHEFLVVDLQTPENCQLLIKAEKVFVGMKDEKFPAGGLTTVGRIYDPPTFAKEMVKHKDKVKYDVDLQGSGKILMKDLLDILGACDPRYSVWKHNCWKYAYDSLKKLLEKLSGLTDTSDDCKQNVLKALKEMPYPTLPVNVLAEAGSVFLGCCVIGALIYVGALGAIGAYKFFVSLKLAQASATVVKGLCGSSLFKPAIASARASLKATARGIRAVVVLAPLIDAAVGFASMRENHCYSRQRDENS